MSTELTEFVSLNDDEATLNITWAGQNGNLLDPVPFQASITELKSWASEAIRNGDIPGIQSDNNVDLSDFIVDRFPASTEKPYNSLFIRPKTPFGR